MIKKTIDSFLDDDLYDSIIREKIKTETIYHNDASDDAVANYYNIKNFYAKQINKNLCFNIFCKVFKEYKKNNLFCEIEKNISDINFLSDEKNKRYKDCANIDYDCLYKLFLSFKNNR